MDNIPAPAFCRPSSLEGVAAEGVMVAGDAHAPGAMAATAGDTMRDTPEASRDHPKKGKENGAPMWELERKQKRRMAKWPEMKKNDCFHNIATNVQIRLVCRKSAMCWCCVSQGVVSAEAPSHTTSCRP